MPEYHHQQEDLIREEDPNKDEKSETSLQK